MCDELMEGSIAYLENQDPIGVNVASDCFAPTRPRYFGRKVPQVAAAEWTFIRIFFGYTNLKVVENGAVVMVDCDVCLVK